MQLLVEKLRTNAILLIAVSILGFSLWTNVREVRSATDPSFLSQHTPTPPGDVKVPEQTTDHVLSLPLIQADRGGNATPTPTDQTTIPPTASPTNTPEPSGTSTGTPAETPTGTSTAVAPTATATVPSDLGEVADPILFVSRQIPDEGSVYWDEPNGMPGVGPYSRFQVAAPAKLLVLEPDGSIRVLIDGENPAPETLNLIDVNAPDLSYDGQKIVFAGLPAGTYSPTAARGHNAWRIYTIDVDGSDLQQVTTSDLDYSQLDMSRFGEQAGDIFENAGYDDTDPVWLPDGRIAFSSTRWPAFAHYSGVRTTNLHVVNADGTGMHRITSERNAAERPLIDPVTGKIVYFRWWRNYRPATNDWETVEHPEGEYTQHNGLTTVPQTAIGGFGNLNRNSWQIASINPDGTDLQMWAGHLRDTDVTHAYGGSFASDGDLIANYFPMYNMSEAAGFGGLRRYQRGPGLYEPLTGVTYLTLDYVNPENPTSFGIFNGSYAAEPAVLPDGRIVFSWAPDIYQDYDLYVTDTGGNHRVLLFGSSGTTELQAQIVRLRPLPPVLADTVSQQSAPLPPPAEGPYDQDGTFTFHSLNIYFNAPVDTRILNAPAVGSAETIRFFIDHQRVNPGSFPYLDWPIMLAELQVHPDGSLQNTDVPADVPLFEQLRSADDTVPLTMGPDGSMFFPGASDGRLRADGAAHVAGMNFGRPGVVQRCVGCHAGHSMIPVPATDEEAQWTNLAPGAEVVVSSTRSERDDMGLIDRRVMNDAISRYWSSAPGQTEDQWIELRFPVPIQVRNVRLYNPRQGNNSSIVVHQATVRLYSDAAGTVEAASQTTGELAVTGTDVAFDDVTARVVRVEIGDVSGTFFGNPAASLAEVEVIGRGVEAP